MTDPNQGHISRRGGSKLPCRPQTSGPGLFLSCGAFHHAVDPPPPAMFSLVFTGKHDLNSDGAILCHRHGIPTHGDVCGSWVLRCEIHSGHRVSCRTDSQLAGLPLPNAKGHLCHGWRWAAFQVRAMLCGIYSVLPRLSREKVTHCQPDYNCVVSACHTHVTYPGRV